MTTKIVHTGELISLNHYKSLNWRKLKARIDILKLQLAPKIAAAKIPPSECIELRVTHNTRLDIDNITGMIKPFVDMLRDRSIIPDDTKNVWDFLQISYCPTDPKKSVTFYITSFDKKPLEK